MRRRWRDKQSRNLDYLPANVCTVRTAIFTSARAASGHLTRYEEPSLSHDSNQLRHTHHTIGTVLGVPEMVLDVCEGRTLLRAGMAGRGYVDRGVLGGKVREAQQLINDEMERLFADAKTPADRGRKSSSVRGQRLATPRRIENSAA